MRTKKVQRRTNKVTKSRGSLMHIYIANCDGGETTWIVKSKDLKRFKQDFDWIPEYDISEHPVNNLEEICIAVLGGTGQFSGRVYR
jgi:hypothetical protein